MKREEIESVAVRLVALAKRNVTGWEDYFSEEEVKALRKIWNKGLTEEDLSYWS